MLFDINELNFDVLETETAGKVLVMNNFYKNPDTVVKFINRQHAPLWRKVGIGEKNGNNGTFFEDRRLEMNIEILKEMADGRWQGCVRS